MKFIKVEHIVDKDVQHGAWLQCSVLPALTSLVRGQLVRLSRF